MLTFDTVSCELDLNRCQKEAGWVDLTHSDNHNGYGLIRSPIGRIASGENGPSAFIIGGNHGDEYEGQIIVRKLYASLKPEDVTGRLVLLPALNMPAVLASSRVSPLDGGNMNRVFPGGAGQGPTRALAGFVTRHLLPWADLVVDIHSGGRTTHFVDAAYVTLTGDVEADRRSSGLAEALDLPWTMIVKAESAPGDVDTEALKQGCAMISCELGGLGTVSHSSLARGWQGVLRLLAAEGIITQYTAQRLGALPQTGTRYLDMNSGARNVTVMRQAVAEPLVNLEEFVKKGQPVARLHSLFELGSNPNDLLLSPVTGIVAIKRSGGLVQPGDHLMTIAPEVQLGGLSGMA